MFPASSAAPITPSIPGYAIRTASARMRRHILFHIDIAGYATLLTVRAALDVRQADTQVRLAHQARVREDLLPLCRELVPALRRHGPVLVAGDGRLQSESVETRVLPVAEVEVGGGGARASVSGLRPRGRCE